MITIHLAHKDSAKRAKPRDHVHSHPGLTYEIAIVRGQGRGGVYAEDRSIYVLVEICHAKTSYLGGMSIHVCTQLYTHVYTTVYTRVHYIALSISSVGLTCRSIPWG